MLSPNPASNENLLLGLVALQSQMVTRGDLVAAVRQWVQDRKTPLNKILLDKGMLRSSELSALEILVGRLVEKYQGDLEKSMAALACLRGVRGALDAVADDDLRTFLARACAALPASELGAEGEPAGVAVPRFRMLRQLTEGQLGKLLVARDEELDREVVIKEIHARHAGNADCEARFERELKYAALLQHSGIVPIYGAGRHADGRRFYAMRYIKGENLRDAIERLHQIHNPTEWLGQLRLLVVRFVAMCQAIAFAHERGVLHRDIKPENVMLSDDGEAIVVDWGLAKPMESPSPRVGSEQTLMHSGPHAPALTRMHEVVGTPAYMSPEQAGGELDRLGPPTDIYGLGATLYCVLTGQPPFVKVPTNSEPLLSLVQRNDFPLPHTLRPDAPRGLEAICLKAMLLRPEDRYESVRALAADVERWLAGEPVRALTETFVERAKRSVRRQPILAVAALSIWIGLVIAAVLYVMVAPAPSTVDLAPWRDKLAAAETEAKQARDERADLAATNNKAQEAVVSLTKKNKEALADADSLRTELDKVNRQQLASKDAADKQVAEAKRSAKVLAAQLASANDAVEEALGDSITALGGLKDDSSRRRLGYLFCRLGDAYAARYLAAPAAVPEHHAKAEEAYRKAIELQKPLLDNAPTPKAKLARKEALADTYNNLAWLLATIPDPKLRKAEQADDLSSRAAELTDNKKPEYFNTRGMTRFRLGELNARDNPAEANVSWAAALEALGVAKKHADKMSDEDRRTTLFLLAMTNAKLGRPEAAVEAYRLARKDLDPATVRPELQRLADEAAGVVQASNAP
jgi:hypothetical protein